MKKYLAALAGLLMSGSAKSQVDLAENKLLFDSVGISQAQSELIFERVKSYPNNTQLSIALIENGEIKFIGIKRSNDTIQFTNNYQDAFGIGSITKVFTASLLTNFVIEGRLQLDDPIQDFIDFQLLTKEKITFKQLANHTSGLPRLPDNLIILFADKNNPYKNYNRKKLENYLRHFMKPKTKPNSQYAYSNLGAGLLGFELADIDSSSYEQLLQEKIFQRYGMMNSGCHKETINTTIIPGLNRNGDVIPNWDFDAMAGAGAIISTVEDLSKFAMAQFDSSHKELALTHKPTFKVNDNLSIGLGWHIVRYGETSEAIWHNGGAGGYSSSMTLDLEQKNGVIILSNTSPQHQPQGNIDQLCISLLKSLNTN